MNVRLVRMVDEVLAIDPILAKEKKTEIHVSVIINVKRNADATAAVGLIIKVNKSDDVDKTLVLDTNTEFSIRELEDDQLKKVILESEYLKTHADEFISNPEVIIDTHKIVLDYYTNTMEELKEAMEILSTLD